RVVMETAQTADPVTNPVPLTVATPGVFVDQVTARPLNGFPRASVGVAVSCSVAPMSRLVIAGVAVALATGTFVTVMVDVPRFPSIVPVIVADPAVLPVTKPPA